MAGSPANAAPFARQMAVAVLLLVLFAAAVMIPLTLGERLKYAMLANPAPVSVGWLLRHVGAGDVLVAVIAGAAGLALLLVPRLRAALPDVVAGRYRLPHAIALGAVLLWMVHALLAGGHIVTGDGATHVTRISHLARALHEGFSPYWDNAFFGGGTLLQFTGPVFHWLGTLAALAVGDATLGTKIVTVAVRFGTAAAMYAYLRQLGLGRAACWVGALFYAGSFAVTYLVSIRSTFPQIINLALMPVILLCIERILATPRRLAMPVLGLGLSGALMIGNHQPTVVIFVVVLLAYVPLRAAMLGLCLRRVAALAAAAGLIGLGATFFLVPFALERHWTAENIDTGILLHLSLPRWSTLRYFVAGGTPTTGPEFAAYVGLPLFAAVLLAVPQWRFAFAAPGDPLRTPARLCLLLTGMAVLPLFITGLYVRTPIFVFLFLCAAAAAAIDAVLRARPAWRWLPVALAGLFLLDSGPRALQPWLRRESLDIARMGEALAARRPQQRVVEVGPDAGGRLMVRIGPNASAMDYAAVQALHGPHKPDATTAHNAVMAVLKIAEDDLNAAGALSPLAQRLLGGLNAGIVVGQDRLVPGLPEQLAGTRDDPVLGRHLLIPDATPYLATARLAPYPQPQVFVGPPFWDEEFDPPTALAQASKQAVRAIDAAEGVDLAARTAQVLLMTAGPAESVGDGTPPHTRLEAYEVTPDRVRMRILSDAPGFVRLAHPWYPTLVTTLNGERVAARPDMLSLQVLPLRVGENVYEIHAAPSLLRRTTFWVSMATLAALATALLVLALRQRRDETPA